MTTYSSDKAVPYVYICTHKETGKFYIGYRMANVKSNTPSHLDLPKYKTSSKIVKSDFFNYTWTIVAEFFDPSDAYTFEQQLICYNWENPLILNKHCRKNDHKQFRISGPRSTKTKKKMHDAKIGKPHSAEHCQNISNALTGTIQSPEHIKKRFESRIGKPNSNRGKLIGPQTQVVCPHCGKDGGVGAMKRHHFDNCKKDKIRLASTPLR